MILRDMRIGWHSEKHPLIYIFFFILFLRDKLPLIFGGKNTLRLVARSTRGH